MMARMELGDLPLGLLDRARDRLLAAEPDAVAIVVTGSFARGDAHSFSDLDLTVISAGEPRLNGYRTWFVPLGDGREIHVSAGATSVAAFLRAASRPTGPSDWSLGLPTDEAGLYLWRRDTPAVVGQSPEANDEVTAIDGLPDSPIVRRPFGPPETEDFVESAVKVARCARERDSLSARVQAQALGRRAPGLLLPFNPTRGARDVRDAYALALSFPDASEGYRDDLLTILGLLPRDDRAVIEAARRLALGCLALLRTRALEADPQDGIAAALRDGTLERRVRGAFEAADRGLA